MATMNMNTIVVSDLHLGQLEAATSGLWKRYNQPQYAAGKRVIQLFRTLTAKTNEPFEFVFNGDTFDFDQVTLKSAEQAMKKSKEQLGRIVATSCDVSQKKIQVLIQDHKEFFQELGKLIAKGHRVVFVRGNHDVELVWSEVQMQIQETILGYAGDAAKRARQQCIRFCDWFYYKKDHFYIEHGNQYDRFAANDQNLHPFTRNKNVELTFGSISSRLVAGRLGFFNPNVEESYLRTVWGYLKHFWNYHRPHKKPLFRPWVHGTWQAFLYSTALVKQKSLESMKIQTEKLKQLATESSMSLEIVKRIESLKMPSALTSKAKIFKMIGMDRITATFAAVIVVFVLFMTNLVLQSTLLWFGIVGVIALYVGIFFLMQRTKTTTKESNFEEAIPKIAEVIDAPNIIMGHTHVPLKKKLATRMQRWYLNSGTWAPSFYDVECKKKVENTDTFVWIRDRTANVFQWEGSSWILKSRNNTSGGEHKATTEQSKRSNKIPNHHS